MIIKQRHLDRMMAKQRAMFGSENLLINEHCLADMNRLHNFDAPCVPFNSPNSSNPCIFFCSSCNTAVTIHRYGRPFIDGRGYVVRRCLNDGTNRAHTNDDYPRCTDKHVLLKRRQIRWNMTPEGSGIGRYTVGQMVDPAGQMERERQRQLERETTNVRPSEFDPEIRQRAMADGRIQRITSTPGQLLGTIENVDPLVELTRRSTPAHARADCGGCAGYYDANGRLIKHRTLSARELL